MKIRNGFVSNSSSSSFVIAVREDCEESDIEKWVDDNEDSIRGFLREEWDYVSSEIDEDGVAITGDQQFDLFKAYIIDELMGRKGFGMQLDDWSIVGGEFGTDYSEYPFGVFLYKFPKNIVSEKFKTQSV